ncbi:hypothetical protein RGQ15_11510 [Paracoccus sp. MBLB3053]|uniref:Uncharacterized protein n=1 Tax=Paracoccus aurantius TaxID=3073814 RepID=A0ABU2HT51_9RHOB|nr:hypothetical protein [Paracoccus sp. MBLB3053]MDS9468193.1 hypothetical protein [Paracoccus sp. MBLB3053]
MRKPEPEMLLGARFVRNSEPNDENERLIKHLSAGQPMAIRFLEVDS